MTLTEFIAHIRGFTGIQDTDAQPDATIVGWIRMAEERISTDLHCSDMVKIYHALVKADRVVFPDDWRSNDFVREIAVTELRWKPRSEFYRLADSTGWYTTSGNYLILGGEVDAVDGRDIEVTYFGDVPPLTDAATWLSRRYPLLLTSATMAIASGGMIEDERAVKWELATSDRINKMNDEYRLSIAAGSRLNRRVKGFG